MIQFILFYHHFSKIELENESLITIINIKISGFMIFLYEKSEMLLITINMKHKIE